MNEWARTTPTEEGYYWYWNPTDRLGVHMVNLSWRTKGVKLVWWEHSAWDVENAPGWWLGPVEKPKPPTGKQRKGA